MAPWSVHPAGACRSVNLYGVGFESTNPSYAAGTVPSGPLGVLRSSVSVRVGGIEAKYVWVGLAPGFAGLFQIQFLVPMLPTGEYPVSVVADGVATQPGSLF
ncbi:MAG: hypothetical protein ACRD7E_03370, partial [Bryobacteraceae bacterium]